MAQQQLKFEGAITIANPVGALSGQPTVLMTLNETVYLKRVLSTNMTLDADPVVSVDLGTLDAVNFVSIRAYGGYLRVRITTSQGASQAIPCDPNLIIRSDDVNITAIDLLRESTVDTEVYVVLGEKA
jgi:hypothetical protein